MAKTDRPRLDHGDSLVATLLPKMPPVKDRIHHRLTLLRGWMEEGVPPEWIHQIPKSLRDLARWHETALGILPIPSPNDMSGNHKCWGREVREMKAILCSLHGRYGRRARRRPQSYSATSVQPQLDANEDAWKRVVTQWQVERDAATVAREMLESQRAECLDLRKRISVLVGEITVLRRDLAREREKAKS